MDINTKLEVIDSLRSEIKRHEKVINDINMFKSQIPRYEDPDRTEATRMELLHRVSLISKLLSFAGIEKHDANKGGGHLTEHADFNYDLELLDYTEVFFQMRVKKMREELSNHLKNVTADA